MICHFHLLRRISSCWEPLCLVTWSRPIPCQLTWFFSLEVRKYFLFLVVGLRGARLYSSLLVRRNDVKYGSLFGAFLEDKQMATEENQSQCVDVETAKECPVEREHEYQIIVSHANIIRYFVCRALQIPLEAWLRLSFVQWICRVFGDPFYGRSFA